MGKIDINKFVVFKLGSEDCGIDIQKVTTIEKTVSITRVPKTPDFIRGVINLRGEIIPVMDLRIRLNLPPIEDMEDTRIIIIKIGEISAGMVVDSVEEVLQLAEESIENIANFSSDLSLDYILGVGKVNNRIVTLLNLEKLVTSF